MHFNREAKPVVELLTEADISTEPATEGLDFGNVAGALAGAGVSTHGALGRDTLLTQTIQHRIKVIWPTAQRAPKLDGTSGPHELEGPIPSDLALAGDVLNCQESRAKNC